jgi:hypothetical protein
MSTFNVTSFKSALTNGGARPNQFKVLVTYPAIAGAGIAGLRTEFLINIAELPGQTINPAVVLYRGREVKFAGDRIFAPWTTTILNDSQFSIRRAIENWMNGMEDLQTKNGALNPSTYQTNILVDQLDRNGGILKRYELREAFPIELSPIALDFSANDQISTFTCTWQYQTFETII